MKIIQHHLISISNQVEKRKACFLIKKPVCEKKKKMHCLRIPSTTCKKVTRVGKSGRTPKGIKGNTKKINLGVIPFLPRYHYNQTPKLWQNFDQNEKVPVRRCLTVPTPPQLVQTTRSRCRWAQHSKIISLPYNSIPNLLLTSILVFFSGKYLALVVPPAFLQHLTEDSLSWNIL